jgi:WD40 repeat protein
VEKEIHELVFSPDGSRLVGNPYGGTLYLWDAQTGDELAVLEAESSPWEMNFSPDSSLLLTRHFDDTAYLWNASTGERLLMLPETARPNPDWTYAAYWNGGTIDVIDLSTGTPTELVVIESYLGQTNTLNAASGQATFVVDAQPGEPKSAAVYDLQTGDTTVTLPLTGILWEITFSSDGTRVATNTYDSSTGQPTINLWNTAAPESPLATLENSSRLGNLLFSPDGGVLALSGGNTYFGTEQLFDLENQTLASWSVENYGISSHAFSPNGLFLATGGYDSSVALWDVEATLARAADTDGEEFYGVGLVIVSLDIHSEVPQMVFSPDGEQLAVVVLTGIYPEGDGTRHYQIYLWDVEDLLAVSTAGGWVSTRGEDFVQIVLPEALSPLYSPDGTLLLTGEWESDILHLWDAQTGEIVATLTGSTVSAFSPDGSLLAIHSDTSISLWDVDALIDGDSSPLAVLTSANQGIQELAFNPDGSLLYVRDTSGVSVWGIPLAES